MTEIVTSAARQFLYCNEKIQQLAPCQDVTSMAYNFPNTYAILEHSRPSSSFDLRCIPLTSIKGVIPIVYYFSFPERDYLQNKDILQVLQRICCIILLIKAPTIFYW